MSRETNEHCLLLDFYDSHDIWHFLSALSLFLGFMVSLLALIVRHVFVKFFYIKPIIDNVFLTQKSGDDRLVISWQAEAAAWQPIVKSAITG